MDTFLIMLKHPFNSEKHNTHGLIYEVLEVIEDPIDISIFGDTYYKIRPINTNFESQLISKRLVHKL